MGIVFWGWSRLLVWTLKGNAENFVGHWVIVLVLVICISVEL